MTKTKTKKAKSRSRKVSPADKPKPTTLAVPGLMGNECVETAGLSVSAIRLLKDDAKTAHEKFVNQPLFSRRQISEAMDNERAIGESKALESVHRDRVKQFLIGVDAAPSEGVGTFFVTMDIARSLAFALHQRGF